jgi:hypothetical protein
LVLSSVPAALLSGDNEVLQVLAERQQVIDVLYPRIEKLASQEILLQAPVVSGRRFLLSALRIVPELEPGRGQGRCPGRSRPLAGVHIRVSSRRTVPAVINIRPTAKAIAAGCG